ncbi:MAG: RHS repeat-associated core domain-containing protein, partial [Faecousia sp.]
GQLTQAVNGSTTYSYAYDAAGNLLTANGNTYTYGNASWADLLTAYNGHSITYDAIGNPLSYYNGTSWNFTWEGSRRLSAANNGSTSIAYTYAVNGLRTSKTVNGTLHTYYYAGGKLLRETCGSNTLDFAYDASGNPFSLTYNGTKYYYVTNLQGDVFYLVDSNGSTVASYTYDPYGKVLSATGSLATANPLRYRGYYYDTETGFYYLQSRYYDPELGRFLNADAFAATGQGVLGNNMFAYCLNNPANRTDTSGTISLWYYLIVDHDMGFIHRMVQVHIKATGGPDIKTELVLTGLGRADVVDKSLGVVWEVKHSGMFPEERMLEAVVQATGYIGGEYKDCFIVSLGESDRFEGTFCITCSGQNYEVKYYTPVDGAILYSVKETTNSKGEYAFVYEYKPKTAPKELDHCPGFIAVPAGTVGFCTGGGQFNGIVRNKYCFI